MRVGHEPCHPVISRIPGACSQGYVRSPDDRAKPATEKARAFEVARRMAEEVAEGLIPGSLLTGIREITG